MNTYIAFLRGINVGGNSLIKMADLKDCLTSTELKDVRTYIQSGNVIFSTSMNNKVAVASFISDKILQKFGIKVAVALFSKTEWQDVIESAPRWWGRDPAWKHNIIIVIGQTSVQDIIHAIGELKPDIEAISPGNGVVYQSLSWDQFGKTTSGKLASNPAYKNVTIRNYNTATKLVTLLG